jgi:ubiquinone/menaquinone biosynthesis C-methylase UbiE
MSSSLSRNALRTAYRAQQRGFFLQCLAAHRVFRSLMGSEFRPRPEELAALEAGYDQAIERDWADADADVYPRQLLFQLPAAEYAKVFPKLLSDFPRIARRAKRGDFQDLPADVNLTAYPAYYRRNYHWQTDGYFSRRSAELYDVGAEFVLFGMADVLRRRVLPHVARYVTEQGLQRAQILDVASGTGSLLRQMAAAYPEHKYYGIELSPFYAEFARERLGRADAVFVSDNAEAMPFKDGYFDVVTCAHLLHELPRSARGNVLREMRRVLKPGGLLVIEDSIQADAERTLLPFQQRFADEFHEPYYRDYLKDDLASALHGAGLAVRSVETHFLAKIAVAKCPPVKRSVRLSRRLD